MKKRADLLLVEKNIAETRSKAQAMIMAGEVYINGNKIFKSGETFNIDDNIDVKSLNSKWVSRGAQKLIHAIDYFNIDVSDFVCLDLGASTGGFTEVLLHKKAKKVYSVDVGKNQMHERLLKNNKVINIPKTNARYLKEKNIPEKVNIIVCDVSFISMQKVIKPSLIFLKKNSGVIISLIKPQFESNKNEIKKGGIIKDINIHNRICDYYREWFISDCNMKVLGVIPSPIKGTKGNKEFLICATR